MRLVSHERAEVSMVVLEFLLKQRDGGRSVEDDPGLRRGALRARIRPAD